MKKSLYSIFGAIFLLSSFLIPINAEEIIKSTDTVSVVQYAETIKPVNPFENKYTKLAKKLTPTVVFIDVALMLYDQESEEFTQRHITGSGVFISESGHVLTCAHLFTNPHIQWVTIVTHDKQRLLVEVLYVDFKKDLALLRPWYTLKDVKYTKVITRPKIELGEEVFALGYPFSLGINFTNGIVTGGIISGRLNQTVFWTNVVLNSGNSGGPLFDIEGNLIGINVMIITPSFFGSWAGNSLSVTLEEIQNFLDKFRGF